MQLANLAGKTVFITGASQRIGAVVVRTLHKQGANIVLHYRSSQAPAQALQKSLNDQRPNSCYILQAELLNTVELPHLMKKVVACTGRLDVLINNASSFFPTYMGDISEQNWDDLMGTNAKVPLFLSQSAAPHLKQTSGCIINMVDIHGMRPLKSHPVYSMAKAALCMLTQSLARELAPEIRVNGVAPGAILWPDQDDDPVRNLTIIEQTALKRQGTPEDIARTILFLVRDAPYITGQIIPVDGGRLLNH